MTKKYHLELYKRFNAAMGEKVLQLRTKKGWTQDELAARSGINRPTIAMMETGRQGVSTLYLVLLSHAFGVPPARLLPEVDFTPRKK